MRKSCLLAAWVLCCSLLGVECGETLTRIYGFDPVVVGVEAHLTPPQARSLFRIDETRQDYLDRVRVYFWLQDGAEGIRELARHLSVRATEGEDYLSENVGLWVAAGAFDTQLGRSIQAVLKDHWAPPAVGRSLSAEDIGARVRDWMEKLTLQEYETLIRWSAARQVIRIDLSNVASRDHYRVFNQAAKLVRSSSEAKRALENALARVLKLQMARHSSKNSTFVVWTASIIKTLPSGVDYRTVSGDEVRVRAAEFVAGIRCLGRFETELFKGLFTEVAVESLVRWEAGKLASFMAAAVVRDLKDMERKFRGEIVALQAPEGASGQLTRLPNSITNSRGPAPMPRIRRRSDEGVPAGVGERESLSQSNQSVAADPISVFRRMSASVWHAEKVIESWAEIEKSLARDEFLRIQNSVVTMLIELESSRRVTREWGRHLKSVGNPGARIWELKPQGYSQVRVFLGLGPDGFRVLRAAGWVKNNGATQTRLIDACAAEWRALNPPG